jgi:hypothetical protein
MSNASAGTALLVIVVGVIMFAVITRLRRDGHPITRTRYRVVSPAGYGLGFVKVPGTTHVSSSKWPFQTLCGLPAGPNVDVFEPQEVSCRECRRRWERATGVAQT